MPTDSPVRRLFFAIPIEDEMRDVMNACLQGMKKRALSGSFTRRENLHITLAFIGETMRQAELEQILRALDFLPFLFTAQGLGSFNTRDGMLVFAEGEKHPRLLALQTDLSKKLLTAGFPVDQRPFLPHITLGRRVLLPSGIFLPDFAQEKAEMTVSRVSLMDSSRVGGRLVYTEVFSKRAST